MRVVVDANIAAAALIRPEGWTARQLEREDVDWLAPAYLFEELEGHARSYARKAELDLEAWKARVERFSRLVESVDPDAILEAVDHDLVERAQAVDPDDAPYLAALVAAEADLLWTRDEQLLEAFEGQAVRAIPRGT